MFGRHSKFTGSSRDLVIDVFFGDFDSQPLAFVEYQLLFDDRLEHIFAEPSYTFVGQMLSRDRLPINDRHSFDLLIGLRPWGLLGVGGWNCRSQRGEDNDCCCGKTTSGVND